MNKHTVIGILLFIIFFVPAVMNAAGLASFSNGMPIGGRITAGPSDLSDLITCASTYGPFMIIPPYNPAAPGPFFIQNTESGTPRVGGYFLGLYKAIPDTGTCFNPETGAPIPAFGIKIYGISR